MPHVAPRVGEELHSASEIIIALKMNRMSWSPHSGIHSGTDLAIDVVGLLLLDSSPPNKQKEAPARKKKKAIIGNIILC